MASRRVVSSILSGIFDDALCSEFERAPPDQVNAILSGVLESTKLRPLQEKLQHEGQMAVYLMYLHRFMRAFGKEKIEPWRDVIVNTYNLETRDLRLRKVVKEFLQDLMVENAAIREVIFLYYFKHQTSVTQSVLAGYAELQTKQFFVHVEKFLAKPSSRLCAMCLLCLIAHNQGPHLNEIVETPVFALLLKILKSDKNSVTVSVGLWTLTMLLPNLLASLPPLLPELFQIFKRVVLWEVAPVSSLSSEDLTKAATNNVDSSSSDRNADDKPKIGSMISPPPPELARAVSTYFHHLYGMFPCNLLAYLRKECGKSSSSSTVLLRLAQPLIGSVALTASLLTMGEEAELSLDRWRNKEPHTIVTQCMGENYFHFKQKTDELKRALKTRRIERTTLAESRSVTEEQRQQTETSDSNNEGTSANNLSTKSRRLSTRNASLQGNDQMTSSSPPAFALDEAGEWDDWQAEVENVCSVIEQELNSAEELAEVLGMTSADDSDSSPSSDAGSLRRRSKSVHRPLNAGDGDSVSSVDRNNDDQQQHQSQPNLSISLPSLPSHASEGGDNNGDNNENDASYAAHSSHSSAMTSASSSADSVRTRRSTLTSPPTSRRREPPKEDGLFNNSTGQKILYIQHLLEQNLELGTVLDPWNGAKGGRKQKRDTDKTAANASMDPGRQLLVLRNELLFERYLRQQLFRRFGSLQRDYLSAISADANHAAMGDKMKKQKKIVRQLRQQVEAKQRELHSLKARHQGWGEEVQQQLRALIRENTSLKAENQRLQSRLQYQDDDLIQIRDNLDKKAGRIQELETRLSDVSARLVQQEELQQQKNSLNEELALWLSKHDKRPHDGSSDMEEMRSFIKERDRTIASLGQRLTESAQKYRSLQSQYFEFRDRVIQLEKEKEQSGTLSTTQKQLLEYHKQITMQKINAVEAKYECIKKINIGLEKHVVELEAELEKYRHFIPPASHSSLPFVSSSASSSSSNPSSSSSSSTSPFVSSADPAADGGAHSRNSSTDSKKSGQRADGGRARSSTWHSANQPPLPMPAAAADYSVIEPDLSDEDEALVATLRSVGSDIMSTNNNGKLQQQNKQRNNSKKEKSEG